MKIVHLMYWFFPEAGGGYTAVKSLAEEQSRLGHEVYIFSFNGEMIQSFKLKNVKVLYYKPCIKVRWPKISLKMLSDILKIKPDVIHFQGMTYREQSFLVSLIVKIQQNRPIMVWTTHGLHEHYEIALRSGYIGLIAPFTLATNIADGIIALSHADLKILARMGVPRSKVCVIPNGVNWNLYEKPSELELREIRRKYGLEGDTVVMTSCVIRPNKGLEYLIKCASLIRWVKFLVVGSIGDRKYFRRVLRLKEDLKVDNLKFLGYLPEEDLRNLLFSSDVFVLPSVSETLPLVIIEAMAAGKPIVATSVGGIPLLIRDKFNGFLVPPKDPVSLANALNKLLSDPVLIDKIGKTNKQTIKQHYTWDRVAMETVNFYKALRSKYYPH